MELISFGYEIQGEFKRSFNVLPLTGRCVFLDKLFFCKKIISRSLTWFELCNITKIMNLYKG